MEILNLRQQAFGQCPVRLQNHLRAASRARNNDARAMLIPGQSRNLAVSGDVVGAINVLHNRLHREGFFPLDNGRSVESLAKIHLLGRAIT